MIPYALSNYADENKTEKETHLRWV